jgi:hypothetical protein
VLANDNDIAAQINGQGQNFSACNGPACPWQIAFCTETFFYTGILANTWKYIHIKCKFMHVHANTFIPTWHGRQRRQSGPTCLVWRLQARASQPASHSSLWPGHWAMGMVASPCKTARRIFSVMSFLFFIIFKAIQHYKHYKHYKNYIYLKL